MDEAIGKIYIYSLYFEEIKMTKVNEEILFHRGDISGFNSYQHYVLTAVGYKRDLFSLFNFGDFVPFSPKAPFYHLFLHYFSQPKHLCFPLCAVKVRERVAE